MKVLLTGCAGFIGSHIARALLARGDKVVGLDNLNDYYPVRLKRDRLAGLAAFPAFTFREMDIVQPDLNAALGSEAEGIEAIMHFAAQAGVRYSTENPLAYVEANVGGQVAVLELAAHLPGRPPVVYASSSSVYGASETAPFAETARADRPVSVYAATKRAGELMAHAYASLHGVNATGLRLFTVYGRFGRPDMAPWLFSEAILAGRPINVFNGGDMRRDFTHVDDIVAGALAALDRIAAKPADTAPVYNLGNGAPVMLPDFIAAIEAAAERQAIIEYKPAPGGDVPLTFADISLAARDLGFAPRVKLEDGITDFVGWLRSYRA